MCISRSGQAHPAAQRTSSGSVAGRPAARRRAGRIPAAAPGICARGRERGGGAGNEGPAHSYMRPRTAVARSEGGGQATSGIAHSAQFARVGQGKEPRPRSSSDCPSIAIFGPFSDLGTHGGICGSGGLALVVQLGAWRTCARAPWSCCSWAPLGAAGWCHLRKNESATRKASTQNDSVRSKEASRGLVRSSMV